MRETDYVERIVKCRKGKYAIGVKISETIYQDDDGNVKRVYSRCPRTMTYKDVNGLPAMGETNTGSNAPMRNHVPATVHFANGLWRPG